MTEENAGLRGGDVLRWLVAGAVLVACIAAYIAYAPDVRPPLAPTTTEP